MINFAGLLLLDNFSGHRLDSPLPPNYRVIFTPPNTTSLVQPMDQQVIANFKKFYLRQLTGRLVEQADGKYESNAFSADVCVLEI